jgi:hypothetical protein
LRRLKVPVHAVGRFLNLLRQAGIEVRARNLGSFSPDPDDDPFYHCAIAGHADAIVTDNVADFPPVPGRKRPAILTPRAAVAQLGQMKVPAIMSMGIDGRREACHP